MGSEDSNYRTRIISVEIITSSHIQQSERIMEQKENYRIGVDYKLYTFLTPGKDEELSEETRAGEPFRFLSGFGMMLEDFEQAIMPLAIGDSFDFTVPVERAYGEYDQRGIIELDKEMFTIDGKFDSEHVAEGNIIQLQNAEGRQFPGLVISIGEKVRIDLNHPLAGKNLHFTGKVTEKVLASPQEIQAMIAHLSGEGCGCNGNCNGSGNEGGCGGCC